MQPESDGELDDLDQGNVEALPPIFFTSKKKGMTTEDVAKLLLGAPPAECVATFKSFDISSNRVYVFKCGSFKNIHDVLTDGCGVWKGTGTKTFQAVKRDGSIHLVSNGTEQETFLIERRFYYHSQYNDVKRNFVLIRGT